MKLSLGERLHMRHRCLRYRFRDEWPSIRYLLENGVPGTAMLDIGANKGIYSYYMSKVVGPHGRVYAFEPQPELGPHLEAVKETFGLNNLTVVNSGLSSSSGDKRLKRSEPGTGGAGFDDVGDDQQQSIDVPVITLDEYFDGHYELPISMVKCDVEGHEREAFQGGEQTLRKFMPTLLFEGHERFIESTGVFEYLAGLGYDGFFFFIDPKDHASLSPRHRGKFVHYSKYREYPYIKPDMVYRDYIFLPQGQLPD